MKKIGLYSIAEDRGFSLVIIIVIIAMLSSLAIMAVRFGGLTASSIYGMARSEEAYYIAEAAYEHALFKLSQNTAWRGDITGQSFGGGQYSVNVSQPDTQDDIIITAVGEIGEVKKVIVRTIPTPGKPFIITPFAGNGTRGWSGDFGPAVNARLKKPRDVARGPGGNIYIADTDNHVIRYVDTATGIIYPFAGIGGQNGYNCDDCPPLSAKLNKPSGVFVDSSGNVYIADTDNHIVRKVIPGGNIIVVAGKPKKKGFSGDGGPATRAKLKKPEDVVVDSNNNIYIADKDNCRIRKVDGSTGIITTYAGTGICSYGGDGGLATNASFNKPRGLAIDASGNLYVADTDNHVIRKIDAATLIVTTVAGTNNRGYSGDGGPATAADLNKPEGVDINQFGAIYIADSGNHRIRKIDSTTGIITTYAGNGTRGDSGDGGPPANAQLNKPVGVLAYDDVDGHILIADKDNHRIREVTNAY